MSMKFICNRWVFTGPESYTATEAADESGDWIVNYVTAAGRQPVHRYGPSHGAPEEREAKARAMAERLDSSL